ncbi:hypothetical protein HC928_23070 [bacterium]|nr:hypothetical protein [bacterium]
MTFAFVVATLLGAIFHLVAGGDARRFALFLVAGWFGFGVGHLLADSLSLDVLRIGTLEMGGAVVGSLSALLLVRYLTALRRTWAAGALACAE